MKKLALIRSCAMIMFLLTGSGYSGEVVYYYHTDPAGTPLAMTDSSGNVVWRADYLPFGEENLITGTTENDLKFVGKEQDRETGLYYFGARYMEPMIGRFISTDPVGPVDPRTGKVDQKALLNPQRLNRYTYSLNNPYKYIDPDGKWPTKINEIHQASINRVLTSLSPYERKILNQQQGVIDISPKYADPNMHGLARIGQTPDQAWEGANNFVCSELTLARELEGKGQHEDALIHLGNAMHTMQDTTSPVHEGYQQDPHGIGILVHFTGEQLEGNKRPAHDAMTQRAWDIFKSNEPVPKEVLPRP
jgi:RHS repeat-associated protein